MNGPGYAVEAENLTMRFGSFTAVDSVSFTVSRGEIFGFLGANGAGKTTTIRMLCGLLVPTSGNARVAGVEVVRDPDGVKGQVGYMSQRFTLYSDMSVKENLDFAAQLRRLDATAYTKNREDLSALVGLDAPASALVRDLPPGVRQQLALVAALLHNPPVVFLDEPTAGVTPVARARFWRLIRKLAETGRTVFVTTHYMDEAEQCGRIALMRSGKIIALDSPVGMKASAFPLPIMEIDPGRDAPSGWRESLFGDDKAGILSPHGMRFHFAVADAKAWAELAGRLPAGISVRQVPPSLEDVFMRLVGETAA